VLALLVSHLLLEYRRLLSGVHSREELQQALDLNCHCVVHHSSQITLINNITQALNIWLKIDTGMHRLGLSSEEYQQCLSNGNSNLLLVVILHESERLIIIK
jgi:alanine racemase